jgi:3-oxoacyl-[acyl-carrier protein] reductase
LDYGLSGQHAIVTGSGRGIGLACARALAAEGCNLILFSRSAEPLAQRAAQLAADYPVRVSAVAGDMSRPDHVGQLVEQLDKAGITPEILVLNVGRPPARMREVLDERDEDRWQLAHDTQLRGAVNVISAIAPRMVARRQGRIVAITSATVKQPMLKHGLSTIYRAGLAAYLKHLANEIAASGVTVNSVCPASIATDSFVSSYDPTERAKSVPMRRLGTPEELAAAVAFFASTQAGFITGASLQVDGGMTAALT